jgi:hypothetical protein
LDAPLFPNWIKDALVLVEGETEIIGDTDVNPSPVMTRGCCGLVSPTPILPLK